jgi:hypothetical protein
MSDRILLRWLLCLAAVFVVVVTSIAYGKAYGQLRSENILKAILARHVD